MPQKRKRQQEDSGNPWAALSQLKGDIEDYEEAQEKKCRKLQTEKKPVCSKILKKHEGLAIGWNLENATNIGSSSLQRLITGVLEMNKLPRWVKLRQPDGPPTICVVTVPAFQRSVYRQACMKSGFWIPSAMRRAVPTLIEGKLRPDSYLWQLWVSPEKSKPAPPVSAKHEGNATSSETTPLSPTQEELERLMLTKEQRIANGFIESNFQMPFGYTRLPPRGPGHTDTPWVAIDAEMCITTEGYEVTRISVVHPCEAVLYDQLVLPANPIKNYLTHISGITPSKLKNVTKTLQDVQKELSQLLCEDTIIVGHSVVNDFNALKLVHHRIIDTAVLYSDPAVPVAKPALRVLAHKYLKRSIQGYGTSYYPKQKEEALNVGHDSIEDATACLDLVRYCLQQGDSFVPHMNVSSILRMAHLKGRDVNCAGPGIILQQFAPFDCDVACTTDDKGTCKQGVTWLENCSSPSLIWLHFNSFEQYYAKPDPSAKPSDQSDVTDKEIELMRSLDTAMFNLAQAAPKNTLFMLWTGQGPSHTMKNYKPLPPTEVEKIREGLLWLYAKGTDQCPPMPRNKAQSKPVVATQPQQESASSQNRSKKKYSLKSHTAP